MGTLGYGSTVVTRTAAALGTFIWNVEFLEVTNSVLINIQSLTVQGAFSVTWVATKQNTQNLLLKGELFSLQNQNTLVQSNSLSLQSSSPDVLSACALMAGVSESNVNVSSVIRPSGGVSFICEFNIPVVNQFTNIKVINTLNPVLSLGSDSTQAVLAFTQNTVGLVPETQRIVILGGGGVLSGTFYLTLSGITSEKINVNITSGDLQSLLTRSLGARNVTVVSVDLSGFQGDYRAWDVQFISTGGNKF
jgi:hypothetical protein